MALDKITTDIIADDAVTAAKIVAGAVTADIPTGGVSGDKIATGGVSGDKIGYFESPTATQNLTGTYSTERMYLNDSYTLTGDVTVTGHLALGTGSEKESVVITNDSTARTIIGNAGILEGGKLLSKGKTSLTGMTGELGSVVTGSPNLNLSNASLFPAGHVIQTVSDEFAITSGYTITTSSYRELSTNLEVSITCASTSNKLRCTAYLGSCYNAGGSGNSLHCGFAYTLTADWSSGVEILGSTKFPVFNVGYATGSGAVYTFVTPCLEIMTAVPSASAMKIQVTTQSITGNVTLFQNANSDLGSATLIVQEIQG